MVKKQWLVVYPLALVAGLGFSHLAVAASTFITSNPSIQKIACPGGCGNKNYDSSSDDSSSSQDTNNDDFDNNQDFGQDQYQEQGQDQSQNNGNQSNDSGSNDEN